LQGPGGMDGRQNLRGITGQNPGHELKSKSIFGKEPRNQPKGWAEGKGPKRGGMRRGECSCGGVTHERVMKTKWGGIQKGGGRTFAVDKMKGTGKHCCHTEG